MKKIWQSAAELGIELHPSKIEQLAKLISNANSLENINLSMFFGNDKILIERSIKEFQRFSGTSNKEIAGALLGACSTRAILEDRVKLELVWTGPESHLVPSRSTKQVMLDTIASSEQEIFIVSYVVFDIKQLMEELILAINRGVKLSVLLERSKDDGGHVDNNSFEVFRKKLPNAKLYYWDPEKTHASVHAKCIVIDKRKAFITSANLTESAMENNMELGTLVTGGELPSNLHLHLQSLISTGVIKNYR